MRDRLGRRFGTVRLSVIDRCNLRCGYCMPEDDYTWLPRADILTIEELSTLLDVFVAVGADRVRLTGGEPLLRRDLPLLVRMLAGKPALRDLALTTNGVLLEPQAEGLAAAGLRRLTVSLDTLRPERFRAITRRDDHARVLAGIRAARRTSLACGLKLDAVLLRGVNDDEVCDLVEFARAEQAELRFIEYMDVSGATRWSPRLVVSRDELLAALAARYGRIEPLPREGPDELAAPAERFRLPDGLTVGVVASTTRPFCGACDRGRLTADGLWLLCLHATEGLDLRRPLRRGATRDELAALVSAAWEARVDRGAEARLARREQRLPLVSRDRLRGDPHLEMHTRGG